MPAIECTLHGNLEDSLPTGTKGNRVTLSFKVMPSVEELLKTLNIDRENLQFVLVEGQYIDFEHWAEPITANHIQMWPRISGG